MGNTATYPPNYQLANLGSGVLPQGPNPTSLGLPGNLPQQIPGNSLGGRSSSTTPHINSPNAGSIQNPLIQSPSPPPSRIKEQPWKYVGYPGFSKWMAGSEDGVILRRFDQMHARVLLHMQNELVMREARLEEIDTNLTTGDVLYHNGSFRRDAHSSNNEMNERDHILQQLKKELKQYDDLVFAHRRLRADPTPPKRDITNVKNFFHNLGFKHNEKDHGPIEDVECAFIETEGDLVSLVPKSKTPLRRFFDRYDIIMLLRPFRQKPVERQHFQNRYPSSTTHYQDDKIIDGTITFVIVALGLGFLIGPLWLLNSLSTEPKKLSAISAFVIGFTVLLGAVTHAKPFETLAATAAYTAVLMVFVQLGSSSTSGP